MTVYAIVVSDIFIYDKLFSSIDKAIEFIDDFVKERYYLYTYNERAMLDVGLKQLHEDRLQCKFIHHKVKIKPLVLPKEVEGNEQI